MCLIHISKQDKTARNTTPTWVLGGIKGLHTHTHTDLVGANLSSTKTLFFFYFNVPGCSPWLHGDIRFKHFKHYGCSINAL